MNTERIDQTVRISLMLGYHRVIIDTSLHFDGADDVCIVTWERGGERLEFAFTTEGLDQATWNTAPLGTMLFVLIDTRLP